MLTGFETSANRFAAFGKSAGSIRWSGRPQTGFILRSADVLLIPFSLMWGGFSIFWESLVITTDAPILFKLWGIPFVLVGLYLIVGRFFFDAYARSKTWYALTDDTALIIRGGFSQKMTSVYLPSIDNISFEAQGEKQGTIYFGNAPSFVQQLSFFGGTNTPPTPAFEYIDDAAAVYEKCQEAQRAPARTPIG